MKRNTWIGKREKRSGAAAVEFAVVSPLLFFVMFGMFQVGRFVNVGEIATTASRYGARQASVASSTVASVGTQVNSFLASAGIPATAATTTVESETSTGSGAFATCSNLSTVPVGAAVRVTVSINFAQVAWVPNGFFGMTLPTTIQGTTVMRKEST